MYSDTAVVKTQHRYRVQATLVPCSYYTLPVLRGDGDSESPLRHWHRDTLPSPSPHLVSSPAQDRRPIVLYASPTHGLANRRPQRQTAGTHLVWHAMRACCRPARGRSFIIHYYLRLRAFTFCVCVHVCVRGRAWQHAAPHGTSCVHIHTRGPSAAWWHDTIRGGPVSHIRCSFGCVPRSSLSPSPRPPLPGLAWPRVGQNTRPAAVVVVVVVAAMPTRTYTFCQDRTRPTEDKRPRTSSRLRSSLPSRGPRLAELNSRLLLRPVRPLPLPLPPRALRVGKAPELPSSSFPISHQPVTATDTPEVQEAPRNAGIAWGGETGVYAGLPHPALVNAGPTVRRGPSAQPGCRATFVAGSGWLARRL